MPSRVEFLKYVWRELINSHLRPDCIDTIIANGERDPHGPFGDTGAALVRMLSAGASRRDLRLFARATAYETAFALLYSLGDPGVDDDDFLMLHEELLGADPSGLEGRPGSAEDAP